MDDLIMFYALDEAYKTLSQVTCFDPEVLEAGAREGLIYYAEHSDGTLEEVPWQEVKLPEPEETILPVITYPFWKQTMEPLKELLAGFASKMQADAPEEAPSFEGQEETPYQRFLDSLANIDSILGDK